jgi:hypothetical protein
MYRVSRALFPLAIEFFLIFGEMAVLARDEALYEPKRKTNRLLAYLFAIVATLIAMVYLVSLRCFPPARE